MKRLISLFTAALLTVGMSATAFAADINVSVEGNPVAWTDAKPFINEDDRTLVPFRPIANALGLEVAWNDDTNTAAFTDGETTVEFTVGSKQYHAFLNDFDMHVYLEMDTTPVIVDSRLFAPARYLAESFRYDVSWDQATQSVAIVKAEDPEEESILLPEVPAGESAAVFPMKTAAGEAATSRMAFAGVTFVDDPDIFEYSVDITVDGLDGYGTGVTPVFHDGYFDLDLEPNYSAAAGTYDVTVTVPKEYFSDAANDIIATTTLTVTAASVETAMTKALNELEWGVETVYGANAGDIAEAVNNSTAWLFEGTPFQLTLTDGDWSYDSEGNIIRELWDCTVTMTNTKTGESVSTPNVLIPLTFDPESAW